MASQQRQVGEQKCLREKRLRDRADLTHVRVVRRLHAFDDDARRQGKSIHSIIQFRQGTPTRAAGHIEQACRSGEARRSFENATCLLSLEFCLVREMSVASCLRGRSCNCPAGPHVPYCKHRRRKPPRRPRRTRRRGRRAANQTNRRFLGMIALFGVAYCPGVAKCRGCSSRGAFASDCSS